MYTFVMGFLGPVPALPIINETIRNLYFHVTMWMAMFLMMILNVIFGIRYLNGSNLKDDLIAEESARIAILLGTAGLITGMVWANFTWGAPWVNDPQLNGTAATMLLYAAYFLLRNAVIDPVKRARLSSIYCIFAFVMMYVSWANRMPLKNCWRSATFLLSLLKVRALVWQHWKRWPVKCRSFPPTAAACLK